MSGSEANEQQPSGAGAAGQAGMEDAGISPANEARTDTGYPGLSNADEGKLDLSGD